jgi:hypothetical protein
MPKSDNKTQPSSRSVDEYIRSIEDTNAQKEAKQLLSLFKEATGAKPVMWGTMIGFGSYHYTYPSGRKGDMFATGFAMRKSGPTIYIMPGYGDFTDILEKLGPHKLGKACLYLKSIDDIDQTVLKRLIKSGVRELKKIHPTSMK